MSFEIETAMVDEFTATTYELAQQKTSRLRRAVDTDDVNSEQKSYDFIGVTAMNRRTGRHADTEYNDTPHSRRWLYSEPYDVADLVDKADKVRVLSDPTSRYAMSFQKAAGRQIDDIIIAAFFASVNTGRNGGTPVAFPTATHHILERSTNFELAKVVEATRILNESEEDEEEERFIAPSAANLEFFLVNVTQVQSIDTNTVRALVQGEINTFVGLEWIRSERTSKVGDIRSIPVWQKTAMMLGMAEEAEGSIDRLPQKRNSIQVMIQMDAGSIRMRDTGVVELQADETAAAS
jgi:hypothetical protein